MKKSLFAILPIAALMLAACQSTQIGPTADSRTIDVAGAQSRYTAQVPNDDGVNAVSRNVEAPYALQGNPTPRITNSINHPYQASN